MQEKVWKIYGLLGALVIAIIALFYLFIATPRIYLNGEKHITIDVFSTYDDLGAYSEILDKNISARIQKKGSVNTEKLGTYKITYTVLYRGLSSSVSRYVEVVDREKPEITLEGGEEVILCPGETYQETGYQAVDNYDGNLTDSVTVTKTMEKFTYQVKDSSGNEKIVERLLRYEDTTPPSLTLNGKEELSLYVGDTYNESGVTASDNCSDVHEKVKIEGTVDTQKVGTYELIYTVSDDSGNQASVKRTVHVKKKPIVIIPDNSTIYLTFDDGPSSITPQILDILKEENVKATFFVVNHSSYYDQYIKRAYLEGHAIGVHSYTHNYGQIYSSSEAYFQDLNRMREKIYNITGHYTNLIRFPGGSSNTVSNFNPGIMSKLTKEVEDAGYVYFDWNVSSGDAGGTTTSSGVYQNVIRSLGNYHTYIVLMHDAGGKTYTVNALRDIIRTAKARGYKFDKLSETTYPAHHAVAN